MAKTVTKEEPILTKEKVGELYQKAVQAEEKPALTHEQLLEALFFFWDGFERSSLNFFLVKDTAKQVIEGKDLSGDKLTVGIRKLEWDSGQERIFKAFIEHEGIKNHNMFGKAQIYRYKEVPVYIYTYEQNPCLDSLDTVFYGNETFMIPNPFKTFEEKYDR